VKQCRCQLHLIEKTGYSHFFACDVSQIYEFSQADAIARGAHNQRHALFRYKTLSLRRRYNFGIAWGSAGEAGGSLVYLYGVP
jgi:hypothetical protein